MAGDIFQHSVDVLHYVGVSDPHNPKALATEPSGPTIVVFDLPCVRVAVDLYNKPGISTEEVRNERPQPDLTAEFMAMKLAAAKLGPELLLGKS